MENKHSNAKFISTLCLNLTFSLITTSCINQIESEVKPGTVPITFSTKIVSPKSRSTETLFKQGDKVGLFAMLHSTEINEKRYINNMWLECGNDGSTFTPEKTVFYPEGEATLDFVSYYPYQSEGIPQKESSLSVSVKSDQSTLENHSLSDFLIASTSDIESSNQAVELKFQHKLTKLKITLVPQEGENATDLLKSNPYIVATKFKTRASYDLIDNTFTNINTENDIVPYGEWSINKDGNLIGKEIIIIPQDINQEAQSFTIDLNGEIYNCLAPTIKVNSGDQCEIKISTKENTSRILTGVSGKIEEWGSTGQGETQNNAHIAEIHLASLSFNQSDIYRIYREGRAITEICKEYLKSDKLDSRAIVAYPIDGNDNANLTQGTVLQLLDRQDAICGGTLSWDISNNSFTYMTGDHSSISSFYLSKTGQVSLQKPEENITLNIVSQKIRDIRKGFLKEYPMVKVGTQYWMKENLQTVLYQDGTAIPLQTTLGNGAGYFKPEKQDIYFYNGEALLQKDLAPEGWKIPNTDDWMKLKNYLNNDASLLKSGEWLELTEGAGVQPINPISGLNILPVGMWRNDEYAQAKRMVGYWSIDTNSKKIPEETFFFTGSNNDFVSASSTAARSNYYKGLSIRCIKE